jgi:hypothetical protein
MGEKNKYVPLTPLLIRIILFKGSIAIASVNKTSEVALSAEY